MYSELEKEQARDKIVKDAYGQILRDGVEVMNRLVKYFQHVLHVEDVKEANLNIVGDRRIPVLEKLNNNNNMP